jgi:hypothetical protein
MYLLKAWMFFYSWWFVIGNSDLLKNSLLEINSGAGNQIQDCMEANFLFKCSDLFLSILIIDFSFTVYCATPPFPLVWFAKSVMDHMDIVHLCHNVH